MIGELIKLSPEEHEAEAAAREPSAFHQLCIRLSGADPETMRHCPRHIPELHARLGMTLFIPFGLALASGGYTIYVLNGHTGFLTALIFGLFWGLAVLAIDVAIVSQLRKGSELYEGVDTFFQRVIRGGKKTGSGLLVFFARLLMAGILGFIMSHTLVLGLFDHRITSEIEKVRDSEVKVLAQDQVAKMDKLVAEKPGAPVEPKWENFQPHFDEFGKLILPADKEAAKALEAINTTRPKPGDPAAEPVEDAALETNARLSGKQKELADLREKVTSVKEEREKVRAEAADFSRRASSEKFTGAETGKAGGGPFYDWLNQQAQTKAAAVQAKEIEVTEAERNLRVAETGMDAMRAEVGLQLKLEEEQRLKLEEENRVKIVEGAKQRFAEAVKGYAAAQVQYQEDQESYRKRVDRLEVEQSADLLKLKTEPRSDLLYRTEYLERLLASEKTLNFWRWVLLAALFIIDTVPVLVKMFKAGDCYDWYVTRKEEEFLEVQRSALRETRLHSQKRQEVDRAAVARARATAAPALASL